MMFVARNRWIPVLALTVMVAALLVPLAAPRQAQAADYSCYSAGSCPNHGQCSGVFVDRSGCKVTCYVYVAGGPDSGEIDKSGDATCSASSGGGGGGDDGYDDDWWCGEHGCY